MDRLSIVMVRGSLVWLMLGILVGGVMLVDRAVPGNWIAWFAPSHGHVLFVGWFLQFALGIAYWLLPRKRSATMPLGYRERWGIVGVLCLNGGLACRVLAEPLERSGRASDATLAMLGLSSTLQVVAVAIFISQLWPRIYGRARLGKPAGKGSATGPPGA